MNTTYLTETMRVIAQKISDAMPNTSARVGLTAPPSIPNTVCTAYSGLVPMSPNTTPSAPSVSPEATAGRRRSARERLGAVAVVFIARLAGWTDDHDLAGRVVEQPGDVAGVEPVAGRHDEPVEALVRHRPAPGV